MQSISRYPGQGGIIQRNDAICFLDQSLDGQD